MHIQERLGVPPTTEVTELHATKFEEMDKIVSRGKELGVRQLLEGEAEPSGACCI